MGEEALVERMRRWGGLVLPLASALAVAAVVAVLTMPHRDVIDAAGQKHLDVGGYTVRYPATWHRIKAGDHKHPAEAAVTSVFLASIPMRGNCARTSDGLACGKPISGQDDQLVQVDACLAGAAHDHDRALAAIDQMLATASFHG